MGLERIGEFGLIQRLERLIAERRLPEPGEEGLRLPLQVGIGDDTAAWTADRGQGLTEIWTTDTMVEGVHFTRETAPWRDVGWKALVANLSDIAAMGGVPLYILVTLGLPPHVETESIDALYAGMLDACQAFGGAIIGGDIVRSPVFFVTIGLTGVTRGPLLLRSAARPGDQVAVTGTLGGAAGGLQMLLGGLRFDEATASALRQAHLHREPRLAEARLLASLGVRCAMDISDGLVADLGKVCQASGVAARLLAPRIPLHPALHSAFPGQEMALALDSGEEYELLFTAPPDLIARVRPLLPAGATVLGEVVDGPPGQVTVTDAQGHIVPVPRGGWDHFRS